LFLRSRSSEKEDRLLNSDGDEDVEVMINSFQRHPDKLKGGKYSDMMELLAAYRRSCRNPEVLPLMVPRFIFFKICVH
ncbi:hypothetical protein GE061_015914, partial [Apolygus lucorum]